MKNKKPALSVEERAEDLLSRMTLREKIAQLDMKFGSKYCTGRMHCPCRHEIQETWIRVPSESKEA